jgi:2-methylcitrate dehydratase PrpD
VLRAKLSILDAIGVAMASTRYDFAHKTHTGIAAIGDVGNAPVIGMPTRLNVRDSMLMNGALVHGIDYDDSHNWAAFHPTASAFPCVLGTAHHLGATCSDMLAAFILGIEVMTRVGGAASGWFQPAGFHPTGHVGAFGCAVAAGWLMGHNPAQHANAQGIVLSAASGSMEFLAEGAWTKRLHPGQAAVAGFQAAMLAQQGFIGPRMAYEGRFGLYRSLFGERGRNANFEAVAAELGDVWQVEHMAVKPYPACHYTHSCADAIFELMRKGLKAQDVEVVNVKVAIEEMPIVCEPIEKKRRPRTGYEAKFSIPYAIAVAMIRGDAGLNDYQEDVVHDPRIIAIANKITYIVDPNNPYPNQFTGHIRATLKDGSVREHAQGFFRGGKDAPMSIEALEKKYVANCVYGGWAEAHAIESLNMLRSLRASKVVDLSLLRS